MEQSELYSSKGDGRREQHTVEEEDVSESEKRKDRKSTKMEKDRLTLQHDYTGVSTNLLVMSPCFELCR